MKSYEQRTVNEEKPRISLDNIEKSLGEIQSNLEKFGLTANQSKIYLFLGKNGTKTATEVFQALKLPRTETYQILSSLQSKGIVSAIIGHPVKFTAIEISDVISSIINYEKQKIKKLEKQKAELIELWQTVPVGNNKKIDEEKFQILQGENRINSKINEMINDSHSEVRVIGNEKDFANFYHTDILENIAKINNCKILTASTQKTKYMYEDIKKINMRKIPESVKDNLCFIIKNNEVLFYMNNKSQKEVTAMWTNSNSMSYSKKLLFDELWGKSKK
jgi:sugar-specific transcriptional regulator TrmB